MEEKEQNFFWRVIEIADAHARSLGEEEAVMLESRLPRYYFAAGDALFCVEDSENGFTLRELM